MKTTILLNRYKKEIPFSERLNDFIINKSKELPEKCLIEEELSYEEVRNLYLGTGIIHISNQNNDNNIFGNEDVNIAFRHWHDYLHFIHNKDFSLAGEFSIYLKHIEELPKKWKFERFLLLSEIMGQAHYFVEHKEFPKNQRLFTIQFLTSFIK